MWPQSMCGQSRRWRGRMRERIVCNPPWARFRCWLEPSGIRGLVTQWCSAAREPCENTFSCLVTWNRAWSSVRGRSLSKPSRCQWKQLSSRPIGPCICEISELVVDCGLCAAVADETVIELTSQLLHRVREFVHFNWLYDFMDWIHDVDYSLETWIGAVVPGVLLKIGTNRIRLNSCSEPRHLISLQQMRVKHSGSASKAILWSL